MKAVDQAFKIGDYIEGFEAVGVVEHPVVRKMRLVVSSITGEPGKRQYYGQADDNYGGARGGTISEELGDIKLVTKDIPFENFWWAKGQSKVFEQKDRVLIVTADLKCVLRGSDKTLLELCMIDEKSKRVIKEFRGKKTADTFISSINRGISRRVKLSGKVKALYGVTDYAYSEKLPKLVPLKVSKTLVF